MLGAPAEFLGEKTLQYTGSPAAATAANVLLDPVNFIGMPGSGKAVKAAGRAAMATPRVAAEMVGDILAPKSRFESQRGAIKMKGGNWLAGEVEKSIEPLRAGSRARPPEQQLAEMRAQYTPEALETLPEALRGGVDTAFEVLGEQSALNNWIDKKLTRYIKNEMATPEDPVRKLAEQGITHMQGLDQNVDYVGFGLKRRRSEAGLPEGGLGESQLAKNWEVKADQAINIEKAGTLSDPNQWFAESAPDLSRQLETNPWLSKLPPETPVYETAATAEYFPRMLGFDHLIDELRNSIDAASDLPARLRWKPEDLEKVTIEQAVKRVHDINEYRAAKKAEANEALARNPATVDYKTYETVPGGTEPNKMGLAWKEIKAPGELPEGLTETVSKKHARNRAGELVDDPRYKSLEDALKYEGEVMGHCVGGYCNDVLSGETKIYSLRDKKGEPHVTIEVAPPKKYSYEDVLDMDKEYISSLRRNGGEDSVSDYVNARLDELDSEPSQIIQIKGKGNRAPKEEYLPFVQDFVRSGNWSRVGDIQNTGMRAASSVFNENELKRLRDLGETNIPAILSGADIQRLHNLITPEGKRLIYDARGNIIGDEARRGYADGGEVTIPDMTDGGKVIDGGEFKKGGKVRISDNPDTMRLELQAGGAVKAAAKAAAKVAKEEKLSVPYDIPRAPAKTKEEIRPIAQRMAEQMTGEFVRPDPKVSKNPAGKTYQQFLMERELEGRHQYRPTKEVQEPSVADIEKQKGMVKMGVSGDTTMADVELLRAGPYQLGDPAPLHGGPRFPLGGEGSWASNNPIAANVQRRVGEISQFFDAPVLGQYMSMGPSGSMFAQHLADANLQAIDLSKMSKRQIEQFNKLIRAGDEKSGPRPTFPGIQDKEEAYLWMAFDPKLRIHFNSLMQKPTVTEALNLPDGRIILDAVTEPELRNKEIMTSGLSQFQFDPSIRPEDLSLSMHPTYTHLIPMKQGAPVTRTRYPTPAELEFSDVANFIRQNYPAKEFTRVMQTGSPRQLIDQQAIDEIKMFEEFMKQYTGKKKGGAVKMQAGGAIKAAAKAVKPTAEQAARLAALREKIVPRGELSKKIMEENLDKPLSEIEEGGLTKALEALPKKKGGKVKFTDNLDAMRLAVQKRK
jgi:hypothetical protein